MPSGKRKHLIEEYLFGVIVQSIPILAYDAAATEWHAQERARLEAMGRVAPFADGQIAAVAKVHGLKIVTKNVDDFSFFEGISVDGWWSA
jgi:tRNA(fMet)-specific endonuclease VapC